MNQNNNFIFFISHKGGGKNKKNPKSLNAYSTKTILYKIMRLGMFKDNNLVH
jgi:hypothetical protein